MDLVSASFWRDSEWLWSRRSSRRPDGVTPAAFNVAVEEFTPTVLAAAFGWCGDRHLAADIAQDAFATSYRKIEQLREPTPIAGWLMSITRTMAHRAARARPLPAIAERASAPVG